MYNLNGKVLLSKSVTVFCRHNVRITKETSFLRLSVLAESIIDDVSDAIGSSTEAECVDNVCPLFAREFYEGSLLEVVCELVCRG